MSGFIRGPAGRPVDAVNLFQSGETAFLGGRWQAAYSALAPFAGRCPEADFYLGTILVNGLGVAANEPQGFRLVIHAAQGAYADAEYYAADLYLTGRGVQRNPKAAIGWYRAAWQDGYVPAGVAVGDLCLYGIGVPASKDYAKRWYLDAMDKGSLEARDRYHRIATSAEWATVLQHERVQNYYAHQKEIQMWDEIRKAGEMACRLPPYCGIRREQYLQTHPQ